MVDRFDLLVYFDDENVVGRWAETAARLLARRPVSPDPRVRHSR
jgi:hypothetical protein